MAERTTPDRIERAKRAARVYLQEARNRRADPVSRGFYWALLAWTASARQRAMVATRREAGPQPTGQMELFA